MAPADLVFVHDALLRLLEACRSTGGGDPAGPLEVSENQARILRQLDVDDPAMVGELADYFGVTASTMSLNLKRLEEVGCLARSRDPDDRRVMNVLLTDKGRRVKEATSPMDPAKVDALLRALRPEERVRAVEGLRLLLDGAGRMASRREGYLQGLVGGTDTGASA